MPRPNLTDITLVLDRSGSMISVHEATIKAFNTFLEGQKTSVAGSAVMSLVQFDDQYEPLYEATPIDQAPPLDVMSFVPRGSTALLDAMGRTIIRTGKRLAALPEAQRPGAVLFVTLTDGYENSSKRFNINQLNAMISEQRTKYSWQFIFLAANQDAIATAAGMGIDADQAMSFQASDSGVKETFAAVDSQIHEYRGRRSRGEKGPIAFTPEERKRSRGC